MLRVGLTGDLGSGKTTVARMFAERGAVVYSSDEMARTMMQPGQPVYDIIVKVFGASVLAADKSLDRREGFLKRGSTVVGDIDPRAFALSGAYTPVPGGVGALTIAMLMVNTVRAARLRRGAR